MPKPLNLWLTLRRDYTCSSICWQQKAGSPQPKPVTVGQSPLSGQSDTETNDNIKNEDVCKDVVSHQENVFPFQKKKRLFLANCLGVFCFLFCLLRRFSSVYLFPSSRGCEGCSLVSKISNLRVKLSKARAVSGRSFSTHLCMDQQQ